jgi:hypothetical protein
MSSSNRERTLPAAPVAPVAPGVPRTDAKPAFPPGAPDTYTNWLDRTQRARARHSAITQNLYSWSNYKNWAERMRSTWVDEKK